VRYGLDCVLVYALVFELVCGLKGTVSVSCVMCVEWWCECVLRGDVRMLCGT